MRQPVTGIPVAQPYPAAPPASAQYQQPRRRFSTALCDCFSDMSLCCQTSLCPCITFGQIAEIVDRGSTSCGFSAMLYGMLMAFGCWQGIYSSTYRSKLRAQYGLTPQDGCRDCWVHYWCGPCALCQEYRELQLRGYDMALGWHANMERQSRRMALSPAMPERMIR